jgi:hypothetical protein
MRQELLSRIRAEYLEMPGLCLTAPQAQLLCGGEIPVCRALMDRLVEERFLYRKADGSYTRFTDGPRMRVA